MILFLDLAGSANAEENVDKSEGGSGINLAHATSEAGGSSGGNGGAIAAVDEAEAGPSTSQNSSSKKNENEEGAEKISVEGKKWLSYTDIMSDSYPAKSKLVYLQAYKLFERYLKSQNQWSPNTVPSDLHVMNYFHFLRHDLKRAPTTLWSTYARINAVLKRVYGVSLKSYTRVADMLKSYDSGHSVKQASIFTPQQIEDFVTDPELSSKYWLVRKVVCLVGYYGGFRNIELKSLKFENVEVDSVGYWFSFDRSKQRGHLEATCICIPRRQPDWIPVSSDSSRVGLDFDPASLLDLYFSEIENDLQCSREELKGDFFRATHGMKGQKFTNLTLGKNTIGKVGVQVATELCLPRPESYTGHCWRRSCGTSASDSGVNVTTLMAMMGWSNPKTAMVYVKKSRMTSLSMSMYLTNVQRSNCSNPFPRSPSEKKQVCQKKHVSKVVSDRAVEADDPEVVMATQDLIREIEREEMNESAALKEEVADASGSVDVSAILKEGVVEASGSVVGVPKQEVNKQRISKEGKVVGSREVKKQVEVVDQQCKGKEEIEKAVTIPVVDPRMASILQNMQNSGNVTINFNFEGFQK